MQIITKINRVLVLTILESLKAPLEANLEISCTHDRCQNENK